MTTPSDVPSASEPSDSADGATPDAPPPVRFPMRVPTSRHTAAWCANCCDLYDPGPSERPCPTCDDVPTAWDMDALYRALAPRLVRYVRSLLRTWNVSDARVDAEGAVNDAFLEMMRARKGEVTIDDPAAWLFVVARRRAAQAVRKGRMIEDGEHPDAADISGPATWSSTARRPTDNDIHGTRLVLQAIAKLPDHQKVATYLRMVEGWTLAEIADYLDCAASTAGVHVYRGKVQVRERLKANWEPLPSASHATGYPRTRPMPLARASMSSSPAVVAAAAFAALIVSLLVVAVSLRLVPWFVAVMVLVGVLVVGGATAAGYALWRWIVQRSRRDRRNPD